MAIAAMLMFLALAPVRLAGATAVLTPAKDTTIYGGNGGETLANGAGAGLFVGRSGSIGRTLRTLIAFDVAGQIPAGAAIQSATLALTITTPRSHAVTVQAHRLQSEWGEGSTSAGSGGGGGAPATPGSATWNARSFNTILWTSPGGDFASTPSGSQTVSGISGTIGFSSAGLTADVQAWLAQPATNFGWLLKAQDELNPAVRFSSRQGAAQPTLTIHYTVPSTAARHSADTTPADGKISLQELTRVIELYNTRRGTERTGCYKVHDGTEDTFASDAVRAVAEPITLARYHSADTAARGPRDGRIDLIELSRVIELYNYRNGTVRTGEYREASGTEDGFAPGT